MASRFQPWDRLPLFADEEAVVVPYWGRENWPIGGRLPLYWKGEASQNRH